MGKWHSALVLLVAALACGAAAAQGTSVQREITLPPGTSAGWWTTGTLPTPLDNGWIVVADRGFDAPGPLPVADAGAVHVFEPDGTLRFSYTGRSPGEGLIAIVLRGTRVALYSQGWRNAHGEAVGALAIVDLAEPLPAALSAANAIVGTRPGDLDGLTLAVVGDDGLVIGAPRWDRGSLVDAGAARWVAIDGSTVGEITAGNALVGRNAGDAVGQWVTHLGERDWLAASNWLADPLFETRAITHVVGGGVFAGEVTAANSLFGASSGDRTGSGGRVRLPNGALLVLSPWHDGPGEPDAGAITRLDPGVAKTGPIGPDNSLLGRALDRLGTEGSVTVLADGHIVIAAPDANRNPLPQVGAVAFRRSDQPLTGWIDPSNALYGSFPLDRIGSGGVRALADSGYLVLSPNADLPEITDAGAATLGPAGVGVAGHVSAASSRVGRASGDRVGSGGATALANGGAVVLSPLWRSDAGVAGVGAATLMRGPADVGPVDASNSLVGATAGDFTGASVAALANGHYVVETRAWSGLPDFRGAVTWGNGVTGVTGAISSARSIVARSAGGFSTLSSAVALSDGHYVIAAPGWDDGRLGPVGAVFWIDGSGPGSGPLDGFRERATIGASANAQTGMQVYPLRNGGHLVWSAQMSTPVGVRAALTQIAASPQVPTVATAARSLYGAPGLGGAPVNAPTVVARADGSWIAAHPFFGTANSGAMSFGWADGSTVGEIRRANSIIRCFGPGCGASATASTLPEIGFIEASGAPASIPVTPITILPRAEDVERNTLIVLGGPGPEFILMWPGLETRTRLLWRESEGVADFDAVVRVSATEARPQGRVELRDQRGRVRGSCGDGEPAGGTMLEFRCTIEAGGDPPTTLAAEFYGYPRFAFSRSPSLEAGQFVDGFEW
jgi:hypothetical protein